MDKVLIDTDVLIWYLRGNRAAAMLLDSLDDIALSAITYMELVQGCRDKRELSMLQKDLGRRSVKVWPLDPAISDNAVLLIDKLALARGLRLADALIAATALIHRLPLVTANVKHFAVIDGLEVKNFRPEEK